MKKVINISILFIPLFLFSGCLTPYDNEFTCQPSIIGKCTESVVETYKQTLEEIDKKEQK
jgi:hypothetical protein